MFDISIGTIIPANRAIEMIPQLNPQGFECYELNFNDADPEQIDYDDYAEKLNAVLDGRKISCIGFYRNPILSENDRNNLQLLIRSAKN